MKIDHDWPRIRVTLPKEEAASLYPRLLERMTSKPFDWTRAGLYFVTLLVPLIVGLAFQLWVAASLYSVFGMLLILLMWRGGQGNKAIEQLPEILEIEYVASPEALILTSSKRTSAYRWEVVQEDLSFDAYRCLILSYGTVAPMVEVVVLTRRALHTDEGRRFGRELDRCLGLRTTERVSELMDAADPVEAKSSQRVEFTLSRQELTSVSPTNSVKKAATDTNGKVLSGMNIILCVGSVCLAMQAKQVVLRDVMGAFAMLFGWVTLSKFVLLWQTNSDDKEHTALRVDESGVKASQSTTQALLPWSEFGNLIEGEDYLFLTFRENESRFLIIPREAFLSFEHAATFVAIARRGLMKGHESPMATPPDSNPYRTPRET